jgi:hypothetical protein
MDTATAHTEFTTAGYDVIPLNPLRKLPLAKNWTRVPTVSQWRNVKIDGVNIGLRAGNGRAFIDCDDKNALGTSQNVFAWLAGLGYERGTYPIVETPSGGHHIYVQNTASLLGSKRNFTSAFGAGEYRFDYGAFVATYPSYINHPKDGVGDYKLIEGDILRLPVLDIKDIATIVPINGDETRKNSSLKMSRLALAICAGVKLEKYKSDSEAEAALILSLINSGYDYENIKHVFNANPCMGHYQKKHADKSSKDGERWLYMTYQNMLAYASTESPVRRKISEWIAQAQASAYSKVTDKNLLIAHLQTAYKAGRFEYQAGVRDLSLLAGVGRDTVSNGTRRIARTGLLSVVEIGKGMAATTYKLNEDKVGHSHTLTVLRECPTLSRGISKHDAFRNGGGRYAKGRLGKRAGDIYELLFSKPLTIAEIQEKSGCKSVKTVKRSLDKLRTVKDRATGEIIEMVSSDGERWRSNLVDLELIAAIVGTYGATGKQRELYQSERKEHAKSLELGAIKNMVSIQRMENRDNG